MSPTDRYSDLFPTPRSSVSNNSSMKTPVVLLLDTSDSMNQGDAIGQLNAGIALLIKELSEHEAARDSVEMTVMTFGESCRIQSSFCSPASVGHPSFRAAGRTPMGEAMKKAADLVEDRKRTYRREGVNYHRPWIVIVSDGCPTDMQPGDALWKELKDIYGQASRNRKFEAWGYATGGAERDKLVDLLGEEQRVADLQSTDSYRSIFRFLSKSIGELSVMTDDRRNGTESFRYKR
jgi:uncharacterized protein YegL